ncbi:hypothetical protein GOODEAATRI_029651 [Goodea atripinnis]|uniref:Retrotransposon gag domain-containing protein n=1 Tax=Goodea atripinnis TaxID=208336 RepID=A0ABV0NYR2_9TELE
MPAPFLPCSGEPTVPFSTWRKMFENYLMAIHATGNSWSNARRHALLIHALGFEGQRLFYTLPNVGTSYNEAMTTLELHFAPKVNVVEARNQFRQRTQIADETVPQYMVALLELQLFTWLPSTDLHNASIETGKPFLKIATRAQRSRQHEPVIAVDRQITWRMHETALQPQQNATAVVRLDIFLKFAAQLNKLER